MNNIAFVEASRFLAERVLREGGASAHDQIRYGFRLATARWPANEELDIIASAHRSFLHHFQSDAAGAAKLLKTGERPRDASLTT